MEYVFLPYTVPVGEIGEFPAILPKLKSINQYNPQFTPSNNCSILGSQSHKITNSTKSLNDFCFPRLKDNEIDFDIYTKTTKFPKINGRKK